VLADPAAAAAMGAAAHTAVAGPGGAEAMVTATEAVYREVLA
jgi:hypothetical protein